MSDFYNFDARVIQELQSLTNDLPSDFNYSPIFECSVQILEGRTLTSPEVDGLDHPQVESISRATSALFWECAKNAPRDPSVIDSILSKVGLTVNFVTQFCKGFRDFKVRLADLKWDLGVSRARFHDLSWRLDVELARRNISEITEPKFMIRLDLTNPRESETESGPASITSHSLQSDLANMRNLQQQLALAISELNGTHSQRIARYIT